MCGASLFRKIVNERQLMCDSCQSFPIKRMRSLHVCNKHGVMHASLGDCFKTTKTEIEPDASAPDWYHQLLLSAWLFRSRQTRASRIWICPDGPDIDSEKKDHHRHEQLINRDDAIGSYQRSTNRVCSYTYNRFPEQIVNEKVIDDFRSCAGEWSYFKTLVRVLN